MSMLEAALQQNIEYLERKLGIKAPTKEPSVETRNSVWHVSNPYPMPAPTGKAPSTAYFPEWEDMDF